MVDHVLIIKTSYINKNGIFKNGYHKVYVAYGDNAEETAKKGLYNAYRFFLDKIGERERTDDINEKAVLIQNECDTDHKRASIMFKEFSVYKPEGKFYKEWYAYTRLDYAVYPTKKIAMEDGFVKLDEDSRQEFISFLKSKVEDN